MKISEDEEATTSGSLHTSTDEATRKTPSSDISVVFLILTRLL
jgi:hypothetical protein